MSVYYLDASAWVKRHVEEAGSDWMRRFWNQRPSLACSTIGGLEVLSAILRRSKVDDPRLPAVQAEIKADRERACTKSAFRRRLPAERRN